MIKLGKLVSLAVLIIGFFAILSLIGVQTLIPNILGYNQQAVDSYFKDLSCKKKYGSDSYYIAHSGTCFGHPGYKNGDDYCKAKYGSDSFYFAPKDTCMGHPGQNSWDEYCQANYGSKFFWDAYGGGCRNLNGYNNFDDFCSQIYGVDSKWDSSSHGCRGQDTSIFGWHEFCKAKYGSDSYYDAKMNGCITHLGYNSWNDYCQSNYGSGIVWSASIQDCVGHPGYSNYDDYCKGTYGPNSYFDTSQGTCGGQPSQPNQNNQGTPTNPTNQGTPTNPTNQGTPTNQGNNPSNANQDNGKYGGYNTPDAYCKGTYGLNYYYDASRNVCAQRLQSGNQGSSGQGSDLTGQWTGTASGTIVYTDPEDSSYDMNCNFRASIALELQQNGKSLTGPISITGLSLTGQNCDEIDYSQFGGELSSTIFGSGFSGTAGPLYVSGQFTSDLMRGHYNGDVEDHTVNGDFTASRTG